MGLKAGTVRAHLFRAIHKIRKELAEWRSARDIQGTEHEAALQ
jgi:DNA-directed RNA polymerase specialized sigma24 family protein